jgi:outer membrane protein assembly factor BamB
MGFKGSVESFNLADVFQNLQNQQKTGTLRVIQPSGDEKHIHFHDGQIRYLARGPHKALLPPEVFLARGLALKSQLEAAVEQKPGGESLCSHLVALGHLTDAQLAAAVKKQIEEEIFDLFSWDKANFEFNDGPPLDGMFDDQLKLKPPVLPISHLIMEAARRVDEWERLKTLIPSLKEIYFMDLSVRKSIEKGEMEVEPVERRVANLVDGARDVEDLIEESWLFKFEVLTTLGGFIQSSLIRPATVQELNFAAQECARYNLSRRRIKVLERMLALGGEDIRARKELAEALAAEQMVDKACIHFDVLADAELKAGKDSAAIDVYRRMIDIMPKHVKAHEQLAGIYVRRGQKREAFVHFQELFEILRDQNHLREARGAGMCALECDPAHADLRASLIDLLIADNQKDSAAEQLEQLGDQAEKAGNVKLAADSYRRAMQFRPNSKQLQTKLSDAMLTKEDRRNRKRKTRLIAAAVSAGMLVAGIFAFIEYSNREEFSRAKLVADQLASQARDDEKNLQYDVAIAKYHEAQSRFNKASRCFSPILGYAEKAKNEVAALSRLISQAEENNEGLKVSGVRQAKLDLENAKQALDGMDLRTAKELYEKTAKCSFCPEDMTKAAEAGVKETNELLALLIESVRRLENKSQNQEFPSIEEEISFKRKLFQKFQRNLKLLRDKDNKELVIELPVWVKPDTDGVNVVINGKWWGTLSQQGGREVNTVRYPLVGSHRFELRKKGYKTVLLQTGDMQASTINLKMEREPVAVLDLAVLLGREVTLSGEPCLDGDFIYLGTTQGSLLQFDTRTNTVTRRFDLREGAELQREIYGEIHVFRRAGQDETVIFTTRNGDCVALAPSAANPKEFKELWKVGVNKLLTAPPALLRLPQFSNQNATLAMPADKQLFLIDCEKGVQLPPRSVKATITAAPMSLDSGLIVLGCNDGNLYGITTEGDVKKEWKTGGGLGKIRGKPIVFEDSLVAGSEDGAIYRFDLSRDGFPIKSIRLEGSIVSEVVPWKKRLFVGSTVKDNFFCVDFNFTDPVWDKKKDPLIGPVSTSPVISGERIYFGTDTGRFMALELDEKKGGGKTRWSYQVENARAFLGPPLVKGQVIYAINSNGVILPFDESE